MLYYSRDPKRDHDCDNHPSIYRVCKGSLQFQKIPNNRAFDKSPASRLVDRQESDRADPDSPTSFESGWPIRPLNDFEMGFF